MYKWFVIQVMSSREKKVKKTLEENKELMGMSDLISDILLPVEQVSEVRDGKRYVVEKRLWPGYLLVKMIFNDDSWAYIKGTDGVISFLGGEKPVPLTEIEVSALLADLEKKKEQGVQQKYKFAVGDKVKIVDGVFVNFIGEVNEINPDKGRLSVNVSIFGRDTRVDDLEFWQVEESSENEDTES